MPTHRPKKTIKKVSGVRSVGRSQSTAAVKSTKKKNPARRPRSIKRSVSTKTPPRLMSLLTNEQVIIHETIGILVVVAVSLLGFIAMFQTSSATDHIEDLVGAEPQQWYVSADAGYRVKLPLAWEVDQYTVVQQTNQQAVSVASHQSDRVVIYTLAAEDVSPIPETAQSLIVSGLPAHKFSDSTWQPGAGTEHLIINRQDGYVDEIIGSGPVFYQILSTYKYLSSPKF